MFHSQGKGISSYMTDFYNKQARKKRAKEGVWIRVTTRPHCAYAPALNNTMKLLFSLKMTFWSNICKQMKQKWGVGAHIRFC